MAKEKATSVPVNIQQMCDRLLDSQELSRQEHMQLMTYCLNNTLVNDKERRRINQVLDEIQLGRMRFLT